MDINNKYYFTCVECGKKSHPRDIIDHFSEEHHKEWEKIKRVVAHEMKGLFPSIEDEVK